ncbi:hypothetical protein [Streptacidiphilus jiangxiensis]|uniref:Uncharacterized protein n=1 Tax=Streptacidiphilus jiangxiensis TaxID=235985 RepID=A0A1H7MI19_STRJI|nr:hypothetical protein [Streptacidiphilus jiangxiensis]SEL10257.1 hypothetical protein SAMN05414137_105372 [Streptacidiphilus jiangxiensis]
MTSQSNWGIQNNNSPNYGAQAAGAGATASVGDPVSANALAQAVAALAATLPSLELDTATAEDASAHLEDLRVEATAAQPSQGRIRRALSGLTTLLGGAAAAATALAAVEKAAEPLLRALGT